MKINNEGILYFLKKWVLDWKKDWLVYRTHKRFSKDTSYEISPETVFTYISNRKVFKKYIKDFGYDPKLLFHWENLKDFDTKDSSSIILKNLCDFVKRATPFSIQYSFFFRKYRIPSLFFFTLIFTFYKNSYWYTGIL